MEIWQSVDQTWEWRVLKKKSDLIWSCAVKSPSTSGSWEYGDTDAQTVVANERVYTDLGLGRDYLADLVPNIIGTKLEVPDAGQPQVVLQPKTFPFLCQYFTEDGMSYHGLDAQGQVLFFFNTPWENCPVVMASKWGFEYGEEQPGQFNFDLRVYDQPDNPLIIPFVFDCSIEEHRYEMSRLVGQEKLPFFSLALQVKTLVFVDRIVLTLPDEFRRDLAPIIRDNLIRGGIPNARD